MKNQKLNSNDRTFSDFKKKIFLYSEHSDINDYKIKYLFTYHIRLLQ